jgi:hypothetical protein
MIMGCFEDFMQFRDEVDLARELVRLKASTPKRRIPTGLDGDERELPPATDR